MSKKRTHHDAMILEAERWATSLGYRVVDENLGSKKGADAIFENQARESVLLEVVSGGSFKSLFRKERIQQAFILPHAIEEYKIMPTILALIIVADRIDNVKKHGIEVGIPDALFNPPNQVIFPVLAFDFKEVIPALLAMLASPAKFSKVAS